MLLTQAQLEERSSTMPALITLAIVTDSTAYGSTPLPTHAPQEALLVLSSTWTPAQVAFRSLGFYTRGILLSLLINSPL